MKLYHATFQSYLPSIKENGLLPDQQKNWADSASGFVYLANDMDGAISFCETSEDTPAEVFDSGICCFEIDSEILDPSLFSIDPNILWESDESPWCFVYAGQISYDALRLCWSEEFGYIKPSLAAQIQSASTRATDSHSSDKTPIKASTPER